MVWTRTKNDTRESSNTNIGLETHRKKEERKTKKKREPINHETKTNHSQRSMSKVAELVWKSTNNDTKKTLNRKIKPKYKN